MENIRVRVSDTYTETTLTYRAPAAGGYYFSFNHLANRASEPTTVLLDNIIISSNLGINDVLASQFSVYPNPSNGIISINNNSNAVLNGVTVTDLNGRTVKSIQFNNVNTAQVNISDLSAGMYLMNIAFDQGSVTKKIIKN